MNIRTAKALFKKTTLFATAFVLAVSTLTAAVPFVLAETANAAAGYNLVATPYCEDGLVAFDVKGDNPNNGQSAVYVKSSAAFKLSDPVLAEPGATGIPVPLKTTVASVPASAVTIYVSSTADGAYALLDDQTAVAPYGAFNCYDTVYVATPADGGSDANIGTSATAPFATIQKALDTVNVNGTVYVADGSYYGTANITKNGTKLIGTTNSRDTVKIYVAPSSGQAGIFASGVSNITIKNLGVYGDNFGSNGALIKLDNGSNARIENVVAKSATSTGININSYSNVVVTGVYVAGMGKDGISVVAQQNTSTNISKNITISNSSISGAAWSAIAFYTATGTAKSIENVTISDVTTQYGARGLYVDGAGGTVTSPLSNKLVLQNFYAGDNTGEYINNEQTADVDARGIRINVGNGVVVPASAMTQSQYDTAYTFIKDKSHKNPTAQNYGSVRIADVSAPVLTLKTAGGAALVSGGATNQMNAVSSWTKPVGAVKFIYKSWTDIAGSEWTESHPYTINNITDLSSLGAFVLGQGAYYIQVFAIDAAQNASLGSNVFKITYDILAPTASFAYSNNNGNAVTNQDVTVTITSNEPIQTPAGWTAVSPTQFTKAYESNFKGSVTITDLAGNSASKSYEVKRIDKTPPVVAGVADGAKYRGNVSDIKITDQNFSQLFLNGTLIATHGTTGWDYIPNAVVSADGTYELKATDKGGNETLLTFTIDNSVVSTIDSAAIDTTVANPTIAGRVAYSADNVALASQPIIVDVDGTEYATTTDANGEWTVTVTGLVNGSHIVKVSLVNGDALTEVGTGNFTTALFVPVVQTPVTNTDPETPVVPTTPEEAAATPTLPLAVNPATLAAVLGNNTTDNQAAANSGAAVEGISTEKDLVASAANSEANKGTLLGFGWYWWLLIIAALATVAWWIIGAVRRRQAES